DNQKLRGFIADIDSGKYKISKAYAGKLRQLLTSIQMGEVEKAMSKGDKNTALNGYLRIYNDADSTSTAKTNAAYNIGVLFYEARQLEDSHKWALVALERMSSKEAMPFLETFMTIASALFMHQSL